MTQTWDCTADFVVIINAPYSRTAHKWNVHNWDSSRTVHIAALNIIYYKTSRSIWINKKNTKVAMKVSFLFLFLFTVFGVKCIAADNEFDVVPKLYEEIGCTEIKSDIKTKK